VRDALMSNRKKLKPLSDHRRFRYTATYVSVACNSLTLKESTKLNDYYESND
jgi:hypothetical protein